MKLDSVVRCASAIDFNFNYLLSPECIDVAPPEKTSISFRQFSRFLVYSPPDGRIWIDVSCEDPISEDPEERVVLRVRNVM